jgi:integrase
MADKKLSALRVAALVRAQKPGRHGDGGGLYLQVSYYGTASWTFRYRIAGRLREMGLGPVKTWSLAEARERARKLRQVRGQGLDPLVERRAGQLRERLEAARALTFKQCAEAYIAAHRAGWRNQRHAAQWPSTLEAFVYPALGALPVQAVDVGLVMKVLEPIWREVPETASRVRGRIESVLDWASARGYRTGENPARWRGHLENLLPKKSRVKRVEHHAALPYAELPGFLAELRQQQEVCAKALEFAILTAGRTGEVVGAQWAEIDLAARLWTVPAERMKAGKEHRVPLSEPALAVLEAMGEIRTGVFVFPGGRGDRPLGETAMRSLLQRLGGDATTHGFRSTFRDWAAERTSFPREVAEMALAHSVGVAVEQAYRRTDLVERRRQLMEAWARYCGSSPGPAAARVVPIRGRAGQ